MNIIAIIILGFVIVNFVHEFSHYIAARYCGIKVTRMNVGIGPKIGSMTDSDGNEVRFGLIPATGATVTGQDFSAAPPLNRLVFSSAGPAGNFLFALLLLVIAYVVFDPPAPAVIGAVDADGPAYTAGMRPGDEIVAVDGRNVNDWRDVGLHMVGRVGESGAVSFELLRREEPRQAELSIADWQSDAARIDMFADFGFAPATADTGSGGIGGFFFSLGTAVIDSFRVFWSTVIAGFKMVFAEMRVSNFLGGLQLTQLGMNEQSFGFGDFLLILALFSIGNAVINSLPGPIVDGLNMLTSAYEWLSRKKIRPAVGKFAFAIGSTLAFGPLVLCLTYEMIRFLA